MKKLLVLLAVCCLGMTVSAQHLGTQYRLKKIIPVAGRQGVAIDDKYYYVSDTRVLYKYTKDGQMVMKNDKPFQKPELANHFGDIDVWKGEIYTGNEKFEYGRGYNIMIDIFDAETLQYKRSLPWAPESGQVECSGLAVDRERNMVWISDWVDSRYVYFTSDDGESTFHIADNIYIADISELPYTGLVDGTEVVKDTPFSVQLDKKGNVVKRTGKIAGGAKAGYVKLFREMTDFKRAGEIEGLAIDPTNDDLVVLNNRGTQIILGMSQGPFKEEGYTGEVHELYIYEKVK